MKNTCINCKDTWNVNMTYRVNLNEKDQYNLDQYNQLYSICEDCSDNGQCESI